MTVDYGWDPSHFLGGDALGLPGIFLGVFRSNPGGIWRLTVNPANLRMQFSFWASALPGMTIWEQLETWIGPD